MFRGYAHILLATSLVAGPSHAYESDQLTDRHVVLEDAIPPANARMRAAIELALRDTNQRTRCQASPRRAKRMFTTTLYQLTSAEAHIPERGGLARFGFEALSAFLEREADTIAFIRDREDLFGDVRFGESAVLTLAGTASTIELAGHRIGTDKIDHFVHFGYLQLRKSRWGEKPHRGYRWGIRTERTFFGLYTSKAFAFADLAANTDGVRFYSTLFEDGGHVRLVDGCVKLADREFDWRDWVTDDWDEALNPSVYSTKVTRSIRQRIRERADHYCMIYEEELGGPDYDAHLAERFANPLPYEDDPRVPERVDVFQLSEVCAESDAVPDDGESTAD